MAYARMGKSSDVYLFDAGEHLELHITNNRGSAGNLPVPGAGASVEDFEAWLNDVKPFDHPECGKSYTFTTRSECLAKLNELWKSGVMVPLRAMSRLEQEIEQKGDDVNVD